MFLPTFFCAIDQECARPENNIVLLAAIRFVFSAHFMSLRLPLLSLFHLDGLSRTVGRL